MALQFNPILQTHLNDLNYTGDGVDRSRWAADADGVDRSRWKFDENGFNIAKSAALETARRQMLVAADDANRSVIAGAAPDSVTRAIDGVDNAPTDDFKL
jgi:hypothetical protein